ncbi:hypothetical protein [Erwinia phyllosphaerae]|uniref:hypothetical protein n=1 Tax=Erwinia phyllosphaerae TaxID=2853256 RepID=UPI001FEEB62B|nr:hypothetical protein [Erwinia phyllosphaerae]MBV4366260.1 hypothetical protein [Erwinia phyllosphaerae]
MALRLHKLLKVFMANSWLRLWHDMPNDPKWRTIAKASGQPIALVQAIYLQLLVSAAQNPVTDSNGVTSRHVTVTNEDIASALDVTERHVDDVINAMQGRVLDGTIITGWDKRQAPAAAQRSGGRPALTAAERARKYRERKKAECDKETTVTSRHEASRDVTRVTPQIREEEIIKEIKDLKPKDLLPGAKKQLQADAKPPAEIFITLPLSGGGGEYPVSTEFIAEMAGLYPAVDIRQQLRNMRGWLDSNPKKTKTSRGIRKFITNWLQREQDSPRHQQRDVNHVSGNGESLADQQLRAGREQWLREQQEQYERSGYAGVAAVGFDDQNLFEPLDHEKREPPE